MAYIVKSLTGPKGKIVTGYEVVSITDGTSAGRYRIRHEGHGYWRNAKRLADACCELLNRSEERRMAAC